MENTPEVGCHVPEASPNLYTGPRSAVVANNVGEIVQYLELKATGEYEDVTAVCTKASVATLVVLSPPLCVVAVVPFGSAVIVPKSPEVLPTRPVVRAESVTLVKVHA
jgi:hypothetical protein